MSGSSQSNAGAAASSGPVGSGNYEVQPGDCLSSIAFEHGFFWKTLWNLGDNAELKRVRKNPDILLPGDQLTVPPIRVKKITGGTNKRHRLQLKGVPAKLRLRFLESGEPLDDEPYVLRIDGEERSGTLDEQGRLEECILPNARIAEIRLGDSDEWIQIPLGTVDPIDEISGVQCRLRNLGFSPGPIDGIFGAKTSAAIRHFQKANDLELTGEPDALTRAKLVEVHGC
jgi:N-acetylmuramoyl-L-alanine amidase